MPEASRTLAAARALLALWNDVDPALDAAYHRWHAEEHVPERLTVPGIVWALRYGRLEGLEGPVSSAMPRYLTLYGLRDPQVPDGAAYRRLLAEPTPASRAMRPGLQRLARWVCTLDTQDGIDRFGQIAVRTVGREAPLPPRPGDGALLLALRLPEATSLPWLAAGQASPVSGERLEGWAHARGAPPAPGWADAVAYGRLPVGA
jgi:hypothetical protein